MIWCFDLKMVWQEEKLLFNCREPLMEKNKRIYESSLKAHPLWENCASGLYIT